MLGNFADTDYKDYKKLVIDSSLFVGHFPFSISTKNTYFRTFYDNLTATF